MYCCVLTSSFDDNSDRKMRKTPLLFQRITRGVPPASQIHSTGWWCTCRNERLLTSGKIEYALLETRWNKYLNWPKPIHRHTNSKISKARTQTLCIKTSKTKEKDQRIPKGPKDTQRTKGYPKGPPRALQGHSFSRSFSPVSCNLASSMLCSSATSHVEAGPSPVQAPSKPRPRRGPWPSESVHVHPPSYEKTHL